MIRRYNDGITMKEIAEVYAYLRSSAPTKTKVDDHDAVAVNNGIYNYATKMLMPFDPEMAFICKSHVNFVDNPQNPHITMPDGAVWDVESWMQSLSDDLEIVKLLWQVIGAVIRPNVPWNKSVWLYSEAGNNGKATLCELMRNLCGSGAYTSISLAQFGAQFGLEIIFR